MSSFSTGVSALSTSQRALDIVGQNIANASTPGYHRQVVRLASRFPTELGGLSIGTGVEITDVRRLSSHLLENAFTQHTSEFADITARLDTLRQLESLLFTGEAALNNRLEAFFNQVEQLSSRPDDAALRRVLLGNAAALADEFNSLASDFGRIRAAIDGQISDLASEINPLAEQIAQLNGVIQRAEVRGVDANDLRDQRDQLINDLAQSVGVQVLEQDSGQATVLVAGAPLVIGVQATALAATTDQDGDAAVSIAGTTEPLLISGGMLGGLLRVRNQLLPTFQDRLDEIARELIRRLDGVHATGLGLAGPSTFLSGHRAVSDVSVPLAQADLAVPPQSGSLFISVTNLATGQRTLSEVAMDPAAQSLQDIATAISAVANVQAVADSQTGTLKVFASAGYAFDFAGRLQSSPATAAITGTTTPEIGGVYTGSSNDLFTFRVVGTGTIGVTENLSLIVENAAGSVVASLDIGRGYEPGSALHVADGVTVRLSVGDANDGDTFSARVVGEADTSGILTALGLGTFFTGAGAGDIALQPDLLSDPRRLAASRSGEVGDGSNLRRIAALRDAPLLAGGTQTFSGSYVAMVGDVGGQVQDLTERQSSQELLGQRLEIERQSVSGVDPNEELVKMLEFQRSFQLASRYINAVNESLDELFRII